MAFAAHQGRPPFASCCSKHIRAIAHDTEYAMVDRDDDLVWKSRRRYCSAFDVAAVMICHALFLLCMGMWASRRSVA